MRVTEKNNTEMKSVTIFQNILGNTIWIRKLLIYGLLY